MVEQKAKMGRPPIPDKDRLVHGTLRLKQRQWDKLKSATSEWLQNTIDETPIPDHQLKKPPAGGS